MPGAGVRLVLRTAVNARDPRGAAREAFYAALSRIPGGDPWYERWRHPERLIAHAATADIVVEGYFGSANTWMSELLLLANPGLRVAHHRHRPAQLLEAVRQDLPAVLLVRPPSDAISSILVRQPDRRADVEIARYADFHERCRPIADEVVVATFEQATTAANRVIERVNARYGRELLGLHRDDLQDEVFASIERSDVRGLGSEAAKRGATPSAARADLLAEVRGALHRAHRQELAACEKHHEYFAGIAAQQLADAARGPQLPGAAGMPRPSGGPEG